MFSASALASRNSAKAAEGDRLYAEQVEHLYRWSRPGYVSTVVVAAVAGVALLGAVPLPGLALWFTAMLAVTAVRIALYRAHAAAAPAAEPRRWARRFIVGTAAMGIVWAVLGTALFPTDQLPYQLLVVFAVGGVTIVAAVILAPLPRAFYAFLLTATLPVVVTIFVQGTTVHVFMGLMMLAFCGLMVGLSPLISEMVRESLQVNLENADLVALLADSNERLRAANQQLTERAVADYRMTEALRETSQKFDALLDAAPLAIIIRDAQGRIEKWNPAAERIFGWSELEVLGKVVAWYPQGLEEEGKIHRARILRGEAFSNVEAVRLRKDGAPITVSMSGAPLRDQAGAAVGVLVIAADITARKRVEQRLQMGYDIVRVLAESRSVDDAIPAVLRTIAAATGWSYGARWDLDRAESKLRCVETWSDGTPEMEAFAEYNRARLQTLDGGRGLIRRVWESNAPEWIEDLEHEEGMHRTARAVEAGLRSAFAFPIRSGNNFYGVMEFFGHGPAEPDPGLMQLAHTAGSQIGQFLARTAAEQDLKFVATHDALTGLPNRTLFGERLSQVLAQAQRYNRKLALLFVDLDGFKVINDTLGHDVGDLFLKEAAGRLRAGLREGDIIGRFGGDEFVILIEEYGEQRQLAEIARKIADAIAQPVSVRGHECRVTASVGISTYPQDGRDSQALLRSADSAMYRAKEFGKDRFEFYSA
jgi:diguanylate cyclase (GGDEF)-like protein/PAS domain S-box-containing protein